METTIKVLLLEDNPGDARLLCSFLNEAVSLQYEVSQATTLAQALEKAAAEKHDVALIDLSLPDSTGLETFRRFHADAPRLPAIVLSGLDDETIAVTAVREGAQDYLVKGRLDSSVLSRAITYAIERQRAEEKMAASEAFYHSLVENLPQNIFRKDLDERFTFANQRFCTLLGRPLGQIIGKTDFDFYPPELATKYQRDDRTVISTGRIFETVEENISPSGEKIFVHVVKTPIFDPRGRILGTQCIFWDITERKRWEERLQQANADLARSEAALRKSHEELKAAQLQLIQAEKMESIGTLAAGVAHEVKNPLAILMMGVNFLTRKIGEADENLVTVLREMRDAIGRADTITRGLLEFSAKRQLAVSPMDLNAVVEEALKLVRHELKDKRIKLVTEWGQGLPPALIDKTSIQQVLVNIFVNAIHAMPDGGTLTVRTYPREMTATTYSEGSRKSDHFWVGEKGLVAEVDDTGSGIPQEHLAKIFDPFFTTKPTGVGTGLGLPVSKKIIELHGGTLEVRNRPEGGARATIMLRESKDSNEWPKSES
jgi:PAS domain S-box-containing protein